MLHAEVEEAHTAEGGEDQAARYVAERVGGHGHPVPAKGRSKVVSVWEVEDNWSLEQIRICFLSFSPSIPKAETRYLNYKIQYWQN